MSRGISSMPLWLCNVVSLMCSNLICNDLRSFLSSRSDLRATGTCVVRIHRVDSVSSQASEEDHSYLFPPVVERPSHFDGTP